MIVRMVHDMVRDAISDVIGKLASKVAIGVLTIGVLTAGLAAPWAVSSAITEVSSWVARLSKEVADTVLSARNLKTLLDKASTLLDDVGEKFAGMVAMALGQGSKNADNAAKGAKHADDAADAAKGADGAVPPDKGGGDGRGTPPGKGDKDGGGGGDDPAKKSQEAHERTRTEKSYLPVMSRKPLLPATSRPSVVGAKIAPTAFRNLRWMMFWPSRKRSGTPLKDQAAEIMGSTASS